MSPDEYLKSLPPPIRGSALNPLSADLRYLRGKGCSMRQLTAYACAQGVQVHMATVARFMASLGVPARPEGSALLRPEVSRPASETAPAPPATGTSAAPLGTEACQRKSSKPYAFRETDGEIARSVMDRLRSRDSRPADSSRLA